MKHLLRTLALISLLAFGVTNLNAAETNVVTIELNRIVAKVQAKLSEGKKTEADLADELKEFDTLIAKHKDEKTEPVAKVLIMKAMLYAQVLKQPEKGVPILEKLKNEFPNTTTGKNAAGMLEQVKAQGEAEKTKSALANGAKFPDFDEKDVEGKPLSIAKYKGKVVLLDFWATWCGPCVGEIPNVIKTYEKHHKAGFEVIGISLDQSKDKMTNFTKEHKMPWQQYFDGKGWGNKLSTKYGINSIPATYLLDGEGKIIGQDLRGEDLEAAVAKALAKKS